MATSTPPVVLQLPATTSLLRVARVTVASVAADLPFTLQDVEDLRIAVDELAAVVIEGCDARQQLRLEIVSDGEAVSVTGRVEGAGPVPELHPVAVDLLGLVAPGHELVTDGDDRVFRFAKRAAVPAS
jgi:anti-sigma regulatory factor (Ser/Thr protein kinase)